MSSDPFSPRRCRVALLGFGTVGSAVARRLTAGPFGATPIQLTHVFDRRAAEKHARAPHVNAVWTDRIDEVLQSDADVVVEAIGGRDPAAGWIRAALAAGKSVVTANKQVIARDGAALLTFAARQGRQLRFEAAVGGAMPLVRAIGEGLAGDRITRIDAILNGTTNAVLSMMEETGCPLDEALREARARGCVITGEHSGETGIFGAGAGGDATAVAIVSDIAAIARDKAAIVPAPVLHSKFRIPNSEFVLAEVL